jgi:hypothetical protein
MSFRNFRIPTAVIGLAVLTGIAAGPASAHRNYSYRHYDRHDYHHNVCYGWYDHYGNFHRDCDYRR